MYIVYIIKSKSRNWHYVGFTTNIKRRLKQHNLGKVRSTKPYRPFELKYTKEYSTSSEARKTEKYLKVGSNKEKHIKQFK